MEILIVDNEKQVATEAFKVMKDVVTKKPSAVLGLATGSSPIGLYNQMMSDHKANGTDYSQIKTLNLDEYVGLGAESDQSYIYFMHKNLFNGLNLKNENINLPNGKAVNMLNECERYTNLMNSMPQDVQLLGIGSNGHIGFNEPNTSFSSNTHIVELEEGTRLDNARFFASLNDVPTHAITMGIKNIMNAKKILVVATGKNKAKAVFEMVKGKVDENCPASVLQKHNNVILIVDKDAGSLI